MTFQAPLFDPNAREWYMSHAETEWQAENYRRRYYRYVLRWLKDPLDLLDTATPRRNRRSWRIRLRESSYQERMVLAGARRNNRGTYVYGASLPVTLRNYLGMSDDGDGRLILDADIATTAEECRKVLKSNSDCRGVHLNPKAREVSFDVLTHETLPMTAARRKARLQRAARRAMHDCLRTLRDKVFAGA